MRWLRRIGIGALILLLTLVAFGVFTVRRSFPQVDGTVALSGLSAEVEVVRDSDGIPHIYASTAADLFTAQGYVHAQDRFWQMDFWRHVGSGSLSELFGESQVETDAFLRTLGWERIATQEYETADPGLRLALDAYATGVNAYLATRSGSRLSLEHAILGLQNPDYEPQPWTPSNSLTWSKVMAWDLRSNLEEEIERAILSISIAPERVEQLYPPFPTDHPVIVEAPTLPAFQSSSPGSTVTVSATPALRSLDRKLDSLSATLGRRIEGLGSNSWTVAGSRTATGQPILANDPHLGIQMPSIWYEVGLHCRPVSSDCPFDVVGFSFGGVPGVVIGHNRRIAWGFTNLGPDVADLYVERINPADPNQYEVDGEWVDVEIHTETIKVAGGDPLTVEVRSTRHGPVVSDTYGALEDFGAGGASDVPENYAVSLAWTALEPSTLFKALLGLNLAGGWDDFRQALSYFDIAPQNVVYADVDGNIGYSATGRLPLRAGSDGRYPAPGWTTDADWTGYAPFEALPYSFNPESGYIVTANQPLVDPGYPVFIGMDHAYGYRANRIHQLISGAGAPLTVDDMTRIQMDARDQSAEFVVPLLLGLEAAEPEVRAIQDLLEEWSQEADPYQMRGDSAGAAAYAALWRHLLAATFDDELGPDYAAGGNSRFFEVVRTLAGDPADAWWDDSGTTEVETRDDILVRAARDAYEELAGRLGAKPSAWRWGDLHLTLFANETFGRSGIGPIEALFNRSAPRSVSGGSAIVNATGWYSPSGYDTVAVPSMRMVVDLGDLSRSISMHTTGQSGHAFAEHYADMIEPWTAGESHPQRWTEMQVRDGAEGVLRLVPAG